MNSYLEIFKKSKCDFKKLLEYGFIMEDSNFKFSHFLIDNLMLEVIISKYGIITFKVTDLIFGEEYTNYKVESQNGEYVNKVREEINNKLLDIRDKCFVSNYFIYSQSNRIAKLVKDKYGDDPLFLWKDDKNAVFRNPSNEKWYGIIMNVNKNKLTNEDKDVEVLNVKLDKDEIKELLKKKGYYEAYHMNKTYWISIILDDTLKDDKIMELIGKSHKYTEVTNNWIVPANPSYFDIEDYFSKVSEVVWDDPKNIKKDDYVYLYVTKPFSSIMYKLVVDGVNDKEMLLKLIDKYPNNKYNLDMMKKLGVKSVRGKRRMPKDLYDYIENGK